MCAYSGMCANKVKYAIQRFILNPTVKIFICMTQSLFFLRMLENSDVRTLNFISDVTNTARKHRKTFGEGRNRDIQCQK